MARHTETQLDRKRYGHRREYGPSETRRYLKKRQVRLERRIAKIELEDAPKRRQFRGHE